MLMVIRWKISTNNMDLFRDIKKGKFGNNPKLKREAKHELKELGGPKRAEAHEKKIEMAKKKSEPFFGLPHGEKDTPQLRKRYNNYVKHMKATGGWGQGSHED